MCSVIVNDYKHLEDSMRVFRIEHPESGEGPYNHMDASEEATTFLWKIREAHRSDPKRPPPTNDLSILYPHQYNYGCNSLEALYVWFEDFWSELQEHGFQIVEYHATKGNFRVSSETGQVAFKNNTAFRLGPMPWVN